MGSGLFLLLYNPEWKSGAAALFVLGVWKMIG
jgi:hypothetical protein